MKAFDDHLFKLKILKPTEQLRYKIRFQEEESDEVSESGFAYFILRLNNDIDSLYEYARKLAIVCHKVRRLDGIPETPEFIRGVLRPRVFKAISVHKRIIRRDLTRWTSVTGWTPELEQWLESSIKHLKADLGNQYEIKAIELTKQESRTTATTRLPVTDTSAEPFSHSQDYRSVTMRVARYTLTSRQAQIIEILHKAYSNGTPDVSVAHVLAELETDNSRWQDTFKSNPKAKRVLVRGGASKGTLRLNL